MRTERRQVTVSERFVWSGHAVGGKRWRERVVRARCRSNFAAAVNIVWARLDEAAKVDAAIAQQTMSS